MTSYDSNNIFGTYSPTVGEYDKHRNIFTGEVFPERRHAALMDEVVRVATDDDYAQELHERFVRKHRPLPKNHPGLLGNDHDLPETREWHPELQLWTVDFTKGYKPAERPWLSMHRRDTKGLSYVSVFGYSGLEDWVHATPGNRQPIEAPGGRPHLFKWLCTRLDPTDSWMKDKDWYDDDTPRYACDLLTMRIYIKQWGGSARARSRRGLQAKWRNWCE